MIKLKNSILVNQQMYSTFQRWMKDELFSHDGAYKMGILANKLDQKQKEHVAFMTELLKEFGEMDEAGNPIFEFDGEGEERRAVGYKLKDGASFEDKMKTYMNDEFEIEVTPLFAVDLKDVRMTPNERVNMTPFIADVNNI